MSSTHELSKMRSDELTPDLFEKLDRDDVRVDTVSRASLTAWQDIRMRLTSNKLAMFGFFLIIVMVLLAIFMPFIWPFDHYTNNLTNTNKPPDAKHWFGTDDLGRDMFERVWMGARISLFVGVAAALIDLVIGIIYGGIMGYYGGKIDEVMNRFAEILYSIPYLLVVILLLVVMEPSLTTIIIAMSITGWVNMAWIVRGQVMQLKNQEYALASKALGAGEMRIIFRHLIPNAMGPILVTLTLTIPNAIFTEAFLSFLGLGVQSPVASWGTMINDGVGGLFYYPWRLFFPAIFLSIVIFAFNVFGDGLRDAFDPKLRK
ncbi:oligopeptide transport system permease protein OppC [Paenibacillus montaniterrae]|uniref:Oligopeptide transport system permease protein OppC n=1 Tax=Paenibacillus montaniterrae TaxID=429341 RepID=A0A919YS12_9BACL|nr:ABC transporter permease [Paenibacillus montaniterrae]GIP15873.1 oligopeptide transport system permease protein OppC [Paenibacillus montaniterrae]